MGSHPYNYFIGYQSDINDALQTLRRREFNAGRYNPVLRYPAEVLVDENSPSPGAQHSSIEEAMRAADADGTRSILDISQISDFPSPYSTSPVSTDVLFRLFGTDSPSRELVEAVILEEQPLEIWEEDGFDVFEDFFDTIGRGECRHIICYANNQPSEIFFTGYSFD